MIVQVRGYEVYMTRVCHMSCARSVCYSNIINGYQQQIDESAHCYSTLLPHHLRGEHNGLLLPSGGEGGDTCLLTVWNSLLMMRVELYYLWPFCILLRSDRLRGLWSYHYYYYFRQC